MSKDKVVFIVCGESGCGKSSLVDDMCALFDMKQVISYTTRPCRGEHDKGHIFIDESEVEQYKEDMIAYTQIGEYIYFATRQQLEECDFYILDYHGIQSLREHETPGIRFVTIYINVDRQTRKERAVDQRGDDFYAFHNRSVAEHEQFAWLRRKADFDYSIRNDNFEKTASILSKIITTELRY